MHPTDQPVKHAAEAIETDRFNTAVAAYLRENLSLSIDRDTDYYDSSQVTITIELKLGAEVIAKERFDT